MQLSPARALALLGCLTVASIAAAAPGGGSITISGAFGTLSAVAFQGDEAMSSLFRFDVDVVTDADLAFDSILGSELTATVATGQTTRRFSGICSRISQGRVDDRFTYRFELVPKLALLTLNQDSRIFQDKSVPDILRVVLAQHGIDFQVALTRSYPARDYCVQYRESDFNFVSRLMEEEGIWYFFTIGTTGHRMILGDSPAANPSLGSATFLPAVQKQGGEAVFAWQKTQELRPGKVTLFDSHFELPHQHLDATRTIQQSVAAGRVTHMLALPATSNLEVYDYPGGYAQRFDGIEDLPKIFSEATRAASVRMEELAATAIVIEGGSTMPLFTGGSRVTLARHPNGDGQYVLTTVHHSASLAQGSKLDYQNSFTCIPSGLPFRPKRTAPRPVIPGTQTAYVVGPAGETIFTDKYGRVKVQFHWDRQGKSDENSSAWLRVGALHAGQESGFVFVPEVGDEVLVAFLEGDPDQPIIVGSVYNPERLPPSR